MGERLTHRTVTRELDEARGSTGGRRVRLARARARAAIQRALLPSPLPEIDGCEMAALWKPAMAFGGDCYDMLRFSTHGSVSRSPMWPERVLPAALLMANLQASVRAFGTEDARPETVNRQVNRALCRHTPLDRFVTFFYAMIDTSRGTLACSNAGQNPPILVRADGSVRAPPARDGAGRARKQRLLADRDASAFGRSPGAVQRRITEAGSHEGPDSGTTVWSTWWSRIGRSARRSWTRSSGTSVPSPRRVQG